MPKVSEAHKESMRDKILDAVEAAWREEGAFQMTTRQVLARAGISNGTLYNYFASKDELAVALAERLAERNVRMMHVVGILDTSLPPLERLVRLFPKSPFILEGSLLPELRSRAAHDPTVRDALLRFDAILDEALRGLVEEAKRDGLLRADISADVLLDLFAAFFEGFIARANSKTLTADGTDVFELFVEFLIRAAVPEARQDDARNARR